MSDHNDDTLTITEAQISFAGVLAFACTIPGTCICFLVLVAYAVVACFSNARKRLDRVSFRLLVYTLVFNVLFGIAYAATPTSPGPGCNFGAFAVNFTLSFSTFFTTCIAINLQLVLVHGVNGNMMEKYYLIGTTILSLVLNVPTYALHQFGWDEDSATCWYKNHDANLRLRWIIGTQSFWISLAATIETLCSCIVLIWMYRLQRSVDFLPKKVSQSTSSRDTTTTISNKRAPQYNDSGRSTLVREHPRYRKIILRIALYPIVSLVVNYSTVILDLNMTVRGVNTQLDFRLLVVDLVMYGVRTLAYGVLAALDPSFINTIRAIRGSKKQSVEDAGAVFTSVHATPWGSVGTALSHPTDGVGGRIEDDDQFQNGTGPEGSTEPDLPPAPEVPHKPQEDVENQTSKFEIKEIVNFERQL